MNTHGVLLIAAIALFWWSEADHQKKLVEEYQRGFKDGVSSVRAPEPKKQCSPQQAALWWTNTTDMRRAKRQLCGR